MVQHLSDMHKSQKQIELTITFLCYISCSPVLNAHLRLRIHLHLRKARRHRRAPNNIHRRPRRRDLEAKVLSALIKGVLERLSRALVHAIGKAEAAGVHVAEADTLERGVLVLGREFLAGAIGVRDGVDCDGVHVAGAVGVFKDFEGVTRDGGHEHGAEGGFEEVDHLVLLVADTKLAKGCKYLECLWIEKTIG